MKYADKVKGYACNLVFHYAVYDKLSQCYSLSIEDVPEFDQHEFAAIIMASDESYASEATGPDNPAYEKSMLPALLSHMRNITDRDEEIEFIKEWTKGVTSYFYNTMQELIDEHCNDRIHTEYNDAGFYAHQRPDNGEIYWSRH